MIGAPVSRCVAAQARRFALHPRGQALGLDHALEERRLDPRAGDSVADVVGEVVDHRVTRQVEEQSGAAVLVLVRDLVVRVEAGGHDDVDVGLLGHPLHARDVAAEPPHRRIEDGVDAERLQFVELGDRVGHPLVLVPPVAFAVVLQVLGGEHEHVLVHERRPHVRGVDRATDGLDGGHVFPSGGWMEVLLSAPSATRSRRAATPSAPCRRGCAAAARSDDPHELRHLEVGQLLAGEGDQRRASAPRRPPGSGTTTAPTFSPITGSGTPTTATSITSGCAAQRVLDLDAVHVLAAAVDHVLRAVDDAARCRRRCGRRRRCAASRRRRSPPSARGRPSSRPTTFGPRISSSPTPLRVGPSRRTSTDRRREADGVGVLGGVLVRQEGRRPTRSRSARSRCRPGRSGNAGGSAGAPGRARSARRRSSATRTDEMSIVGEIRVPQGQLVDGRHGGEHVDAARPGWRARKAPDVERAA